MSRRIVPVTIVALLALLALSIPGLAGVRWSADGIEVRRVAGSSAYVPQITSDGSGGAIVTWEDGRNVSRDIYAQRVNSAGLPQWIGDGVEVRRVTGSSAFDPQIISDGSGGAIVTWWDQRNGVRDIYAQRVNSSGTPQWTEDGVEVRRVAGSNAFVPEMASDGSGGAIVTWQDMRNGVFDIYAQRVSSGGTPQWTEDGVEVRRVAGSSSAYPQITPDGAGGAIVAWEDFRSGVWDVYAQRVNSSGLPQWIEDGVEVRRVAGSDASLPQIATDGSGGAIVTWLDKRNGVWDVYAQRVSSTGVLEWTEDGIEVRRVAVSDAAVPQITPDGSGGAIVTWEDGRNGVADIYAQEVSSSGTPRWTEDGVEVRRVAGSDATFPQIVSDGSGGAVVTWEDQRNGVADIYAQRVSRDPPTVTSLTPGLGVNAGPVEVTNLAGTGFFAPDYGGGAIKPIVKLERTGEADIDATNVSVVSSSRITCRFDLAGASPGTWDVMVQNPDGQSATRAGAFTVTAAPVYLDTWYLAEGSTSWGFDTYVSILNPNAEEVTCTLTYMPTGEANLTRQVTLPPESRATVLPAETLESKDFSTKVVCNQGKTIAVDRTMYWTGEGASTPEYHSSVGVTSPAVTWYLPEGSCDWGFESWLLIQNPNEQDAACTVTYMTDDEGPKVVTHTVPALSRATYQMSGDLGGAFDASMKVESSVPVIPERAMYRNSRREGHDSIGTTSPAQDFYLAEGTTGWGFTTFVLIQNPNESPVDVDVTYMTAAGPVSAPAFQMAANSRRTINVNTTASLPDPDFSTRVHASAPIIAERAMYWDSGTGEACHDSIGMAVPHESFYLPDGQAGSDVETFTLVQNPNEVQVTVQVSYLSPDGQSNRSFTADVASNSRITFNMADQGVSGRAGIAVTSLTEGRPIMVERAMYWYARGAGTDTIGGYTE